MAFKGGDQYLRDLISLHTGRQVLDEFNNPIVGGPGVAQVPLALPALSTIFLDSQAAAMGAAKKTIYLVVTTALTWVTSGQATWQPFASSVAFTAAGGAATQLTASQALLNAAVNLGVAAQTSLPIGSYRMSAVAASELANPDPFVGVQLQFPSALTGGVATLYAVTAT